MYYFFLVLIFVVAVLLILIVLVQNSKGGGLTSSFSSQNQILGVKKTADFLEKTTWTLAGSLIVFCILAAASIPKKKTVEESSEIKESLEERINQVKITPYEIPDEIESFDDQNQEDSQPGEK